tara:strand:+ start:1268 stop:1672 length:405 start_codon:yes stop_codon:yes gene_type:complete
MRINIKIMPKDVDTVAKAVIIDEKGRVLMLKRSKDLDKYPEKWDLPGGHLKEKENLIKGLKREVEEETSLKIRDPELFHQDKKTYFFITKYDSRKIKLSHEHTAYSFIDKKALSEEDKYQRIALKGLEVYNDKN